MTRLLALLVLFAAVAALTSSIWWFNPWILLVAAAAYVLMVLGVLRVMAMAAEKEADDPRIAAFMNHTNRWGLPW